MTPESWNLIEHFKPTDAGIVADRVDISIMSALDSYQHYLFRQYGEQHRVVIHCSYEDRGSGWHPKGRAVDFHVVGLSLLDAYLAAERFDEFNGLGLYPDWNNPGLHADTRPKALRRDPDARWGCRKRDGKQVYLPLQRGFIAYCVEKGV